MVDGLEDLLVQLTSLRRLEGHTQSKEGIGKTLDTNTNRSMAHVAVASLYDRVVVDINNLVEVANDNLSDFVKLLKVISALVVVNESWQSKRCQIADSDLIRSRVLNNLSAKVGAADGTKVLLVALPVAGILVQHERVASLSLSLKDRVPELLGADSLAAFTLTFVLFVQSLEFLAVAVGKARAFIGAHEGPVTVLLDTLHEKIRNPEGKEKITSADFLLAVVLSQIKELKDIGVPGFQVDGKSTRTLVATLVNISGGVVEDTQHGDDTVRGTVGTSNIGTSGTDAVDVETNTTSHLGDHGTGLESVVDALNAVVLHVDQETRRELSLGSTSIEECGRGMGEEFAGHEIVGFDDTFNVISPDTNSNTHNHVLGSLDNLAIELEEI